MIMPINYIITNKLIQIKTSIFLNRVTADPAACFGIIPSVAVVVESAFNIEVFGGESKRLLGCVAAAVGIVSSGVLEIPERVIPVAAYHVGAGVDDAGDIAVSVEDWIEGLTCFCTAIAAGLVDGEESSHSPCPLHGAAEIHAPSVASFQGSSRIFRDHVPAVVNKASNGGSSGFANAAVLEIITISGGGARNRY